uniref:Apple domain-containing protein n=1 Tax=Onchocerca volvulus TaxID=6282 RepID=A0A8R1Y0G1_ONCVO
MGFQIATQGDLCFRVYNESIVINAQPYERRSNMQLEKCKQRCMQSQNDIYSCRSFVYDFADKICDFFAHKGDQLPAKLLKYYEHLYLEPTFADGCDLKYAKKSKKTSRELSSTELLNDLTSKNTNQEICEIGKVAKFLETQGFKLDSANRVDLKGYNLDACSDACISNIDDKKDTFGCRSFDYSENGCSLFGEAAIPRGTRQLKQDFYTSYYEKICIDDNLMSSECQSVSRFPQMLLVGFAEVVVAAQSFIECFENCLKSRQLFGTNCTSVIYFYEELEQNCILNSENRQTQKNLFVKENIDIVDYFEINCPLRKRKKVIDDLVFKS